MTRTDQTLLLEPGMSLLVGTVDGDGTPDSSRGWGVRQDGDHLRVLCDTASETALANLRAGGRVAVTATDIDTLRSAQVKGTSLGVEPATDDDRALFESYWDAFRQEIHRKEGTPLDVIDRIAPAHVVAVTCTVEAVFDQTPGPTAGTRVES